MSDFEEWVVNGQTPWDAYRDLVSRRLITLYKQPGVRPVGVGGTWFRLMTKCVLQVTGDRKKGSIRDGASGRRSGSVH